MTTQPLAMTALSSDSEEMPLARDLATNFDLVAASVEETQLWNVGNPKINHEFVNIPDQLRHRRDGPTVVGIPCWSVSRHRPPALSPSRLRSRVSCTAPRTR